MADDLSGKEFDVRINRDGGVLDAEETTVEGERLKDIEERRYGAMDPDQERSKREGGWIFPPQVFSDLEAKYGPRGEAVIEDVTIAWAMAHVEDYFREKRLFGILPPSERRVEEGRRLAAAVGYLMDEKKVIRDLEQRLKDVEKCDIEYREDGDDVVSADITYKGVVISMDFSDRERSTDSYSLATRGPGLSMVMPTIRLDGKDVSRDQQIEVYAKFYPIFLRFSHEEHRERSNRGAETRAKELEGERAQEETRQRELAEAAEPLMRTIRGEENTQ